MKRPMFNEDISATAASGEKYRQLESTVIPTRNLGNMGSLHRRDIYDDESVIDWAACPVLESVQGKLGGAWVFRGTRVPYTTILQNIGDMSVGEIAESFPSVRPEQITTFLEFKESFERREGD